MLLTDVDVTGQALARTPYVNLLRLAQQCCQDAAVVQQHSCLPSDSLHLVT